MINQKLKSLLQNKLKFTSVQIERLNNDKELLSQTLSLLEMYRNSQKDDMTKRYVVRRLNRIKYNLDNEPAPEKRVLVKARSDYYSFQKKRKPSVLQPA